MSRSLFFGRNNNSSLFSRHHFEPLSLSFPKTIPKLFSNSEVMLLFLFFLFGGNFLLVCSIIGIAISTSSISCIIYNKNVANIYGTFVIMRDHLILLQEQEESACGFFPHIVYDGGENGLIFFFSALEKEN